VNSHQLQLEGINIRLGDRQLLELDASVRGGEVLTVMGPSGVGKSSLLAYVAGFLPRAFQGRGRIVLDGVDVSPLPPERRQIGLLFQDPLLFPHLSVGENLRFALPSANPRARAWLKGTSIQETRVRETRVEQALQSMGLEGFADRDPETLSGGQKSRVALLRLLISEPHSVLLDEPFSRLDAHLRREIRTLVFSTLHAAGLPAIMVTHDAEDAAAAGGRVIDLGSL